MTTSPAAYRLQSRFTVESTTALSARALRYLDGLQIIADQSGSLLPNAVVSVDWDTRRYEHLTAVNRTYGPAFAGLAAVHPDVPGVCIRQSEDGQHTIIVWNDESVFSYHRGSGRLEVALGPGCRSADYTLGFAVGALAVSSGCVGAHHGSVIRWRDKNVLIAGPSGHGKTSIALAAAASGGRWVTEDVTYMQNGIFVATMLRSHLSVRQGTYAYFRDLLPYVAELEGHDDGATSHDLFAHGKRREVKISVPPSLILQSAPTTASVDAVLFPRIHPDAQSVRVSALRREAAVALLDCMLSRPIAFTLMDCVAQDGSGDGRWRYPGADALHGIPAASVRFPLDYRSSVPAVLDDVLSLKAHDHG